MTQKSLFWNGASIGDADTYTKGGGYALGDEDYVSPTIDIFCKALFNGTGNRGVLNGWNNELAVTAPGAVSPIQIDTGAAVIYGLFYENTAAMNVVVAAPTTDTRYDLVVIRRNWTTQTARVTVIAGSEGVYTVPSCIQSPAPNGSGIYDIPLASIEVTTSGAITVTDLREFCQMSTTFQPNSITAAHIAADSVDWADRETRTKTIFIGGGDLIPCVNAGQFNCTTTTYTMGGSPVWGGGANEEGWRITGTSYRSCYFAFRLPSDYVKNNYYNLALWWVNNAVVAASFSLVIDIHAMHYSDYYGYSGFYISRQHCRSLSGITASGAISDVFRTDMGLYPYFYTIAGTNYSTDLYAPIFHGIAMWYNSAGLEDISLLGVELQYTGYT